MQKRIISAAIAFFYISTALAGPTDLRARAKTQAAATANLIHFVYQASDNLEFYISHLPLPPNYREAILDLANQENLKNAPLPKMEFLDSRATATFTFPTEKVVLKYEKKSNTFNLNGRVLRADADFKRNYQAITDVLKSKQASHLEELLLPQAYAALTTPVFLALCVAAIMGGTWVSGKIAEKWRDDQMADWQKSHGHEADAQLLIMLNQPNEFKCTNDGHIASQTGDLQSGSAPFLVSEEFNLALKEIRIKMNKSEITDDQARRLILEKEREFRSQLESMPKRKRFELQYLKGELDGFSVSSPACEFRVYGRNQIVLKTETPECQAISLIDSATGKNASAELVMFRLGFDFKSAEACCKTQCKDVVAQHLGKSLAAQASPAPAPSLPTTR